MTHGEEALQTLKLSNPPSHAAIVFVAAFEAGLINEGKAKNKGKDQVNFTTVAADIMLEIQLYRQYTLAIADLTGNRPESSLLHVARARAFWVARDQKTLVEHLDRQALPVFQARYSSALHSAGTGDKQEHVVREWFLALLTELGRTPVLDGNSNTKSVDLARTSCRAAVRAVRDILADVGDFGRAARLANVAWRFCDAPGYYTKGGRECVVLGFMLAETLASGGEKWEEATDAEREKLQRTAREVAGVVLAAMTEVEAKVSITSLQLVDLDRLVRLLGRLEKYEDLVVSDVPLPVTFSLVPLPKLLPTIATVQMETKNV